MIKIKELFDKPFPSQIIKKDQYDFESYFKIKKIGYLFHSSKHGSGKDSYWDISFSSHYKKSDDPDEIPGEDTITGEGNAYFVFSTVAGILGQFIKIYHPNKFEFQAREPSRQKLYKVFSDLISRKFGYKVTVKIGKNNQNF